MKIVTDEPRMIRVNETLTLQHAALHSSGQSVQIRNPKVSLFLHFEGQKLTLATFHVGKKEEATINLQIPKSTMLEEMKLETKIRD